MFGKDLKRLNKTFTMSAKTWCPETYPTKTNLLANPHHTQVDWMTHLLVVNGIQNAVHKKKLRGMMRRNMKEQGNDNIAKAWESIPDSLIAEMKEVYHNRQKDKIKK